ncbi:hypothetical protein [Nostoc sp.]|uniref:hypothetical protein n=1 Tax=Nostoc sp. TaxID=1180 RepID=UPI002FF440BF
MATDIATDIINVATVMTEVATACTKHANVEAEVTTTCAKHGNVKAEVTGKRKLLQPARNTETLRRKSLQGRQKLLQTRPMPLLLQLWAVVAFYNS